MKGTVVAYAQPTEPLSPSLGYRSMKLSTNHYAAFGAIFTALVACGGGDGTTFDDDGKGGSTGTDATGPALAPARAAAARRPTATS